MDSSPASTPNSHAGTPGPAGSSSNFTGAAFSKVPDRAANEIIQQKGYALRTAGSSSSSAPRPPIKLNTQNLDTEPSEEEGDDDDDETDDKTLKGSDALQSRRASKRIAAKHQEVATPKVAVAPSTRKLVGKSAPLVTPSTSKVRGGTAGAHAASPRPGKSSSPSADAPAPLGDPGNLQRLVEVAVQQAPRKIASTQAKAKQGVKGTTNAVPRLPTGPSTTELLSSIDATGTADVEEILVTDPSDKPTGFKQLEDWIDGGLDMYRSEFQPLLYPIFCHFYLDLVQQGFKTSAVQFFSDHAPSLKERHATELHELSTLLLPQHVTSSSLASRFRSEKYLVRMSRSGFALLVGWLTEGVGGEAMGSGEGLYGGREGSGRRARMAVLTVVNGRLRFDVTTSNTNAVSTPSWEENTGLVGSLIPQSSNAPKAGTAKLTSLSKMDPNAFNTLQGELKLGPAPLAESLREETERTLKEEPDENGVVVGVVPPVEPGSTEAGADGDVVMTSPDAKPSAVTAATTTQSGEGKDLVSPALTDLLPQPTTFRSVDLKREVQKIRDVRKRIRLDPSVLRADDSFGGVNGINGASSSGKKDLSAALPSICAYTFHDALDGITCSTFSKDSSLMATGFSESYIRIWSLKREKLRGLRSDFNPAQVRDPTALRKLREKGGSTTRKLVAHSGPVFSVSFDPVGGTASPPKYLLSASADHTTRLWSLETMTNVVAYRGHANPVWDVEWSPMGTYFATASRDRTARLWSTERMNALRVFAGHLSDVDCVRFHPNSLYLATGSSDTTCRLWDVQRGACMRVFIGHQGPITAMAMSPDGRYLASASTDLAINLWDLGSGRRIKKMTGHVAPINTLSFSACTSMLVSGSSDWTVRCWDVKGSGGSAKTGMEEGALPEGGLDERDEGPEQTVDLIATFPTKRTPILNVQFTPRNLCLVSGPYLPQPAI